MKLQSLCPATGQPIGSVEACEPGALPSIVERGRSAGAEWAATPWKRRSRALRSLQRSLLARADQVVELLVRESGKTAAEAWFCELWPTLDMISWAIREAPRALAPQPIPLHLLKHRRSYVHRPPRGVVAVLGPWNFPFAIPMAGAITALAGGNAVVLKPSEETPLVAELLLEVALGAGLPEGLLQLAQGGGDVGAALVRARPDFVEFTGSVPTGRKVAALCGELLIPCVMELGGKAPAIVLPGADLDRAAGAITWGGLCNAGQVCASVERVLVHAEVHDALLERLREHVAQVRTCDPSSPEAATPGAWMGPMINARERDRLASIVRSTVEAGATLELGGEAPEGPGAFYRPTLLSGVRPGMPAADVELFGPVIPVMRMEDEDQAVAEANRLPLGLLAYVFCDDRPHARAVAERVQAGTVMIDDVLGTYGMPETPWGGLKDSGLGHVHGTGAIRGMCQLRHVNEPAMPSLRRELWWYPYTPARLKLARRLARLLWWRPGRAGPPVSRS